MSERCPPYLPSRSLLLQCSLAWLRGLGRNEDKVLVDPFLVSGEVKPEVIALLVTAKCYVKAFHTIFPFERIKDETFWPLIHGLACHGIYAMNEGDSVNHAVLSQTAPFMESSHLALLDALMRAYVSAMVTIPHVVRVVRRISAISSASELPSTAEEALILWLSKVSEAVMQAQENAIVLQESDVSGKIYQQHNSKKFIIAQPSGVLEAVTGGQSLPALLVHYLHQEYKFEDFNFQGTPLPPEKALENAKTFANFAKSNLPLHTFHIKPEVLVSKDTIPMLHTNVLAMLAGIFDYLEGSDSRLESDLPSRARRVKSKPFSQQKLSTLSVSGARSQSRKAMSASKTKPLLPLRHNLQNSQSIITSTGCKSALSKIHSESPISTHTTVVTGKHRYNKIMKEKRNKRQQVAENAAVLHHANLGLMSRVDDTCVPTTMVKKWTIPRYNSNQPKSQAVDLGEDTSPIVHQLDLEGSFTVNKQHTVASATRAGLPIIEAQSEHGTGVLTEGEIETACCGLALPAQPQSSVSQGCMWFYDSNIVVFTQDFPREETDFEHYLVRNMQETAAGVDWSRGKVLWRQRLKERQRESARSPAAMPENIPPHLNSGVHPETENAASSKLYILLPNNRERLPPPTPTAFSVQSAPDDIQKSSEKLLYEGPNKSSTLSCSHNEVETEELVTKHRQLLRKKIEKRLNDRKMAQSLKKRDNIPRDNQLTAEKQTYVNEPSSSFISHDGPECYVRPCAKSNRKLIWNALCHICLAGEANASTKQLALAKLDDSNALHFFILFKHVISFTFRALYSFSEEGKASKIFGSGPRVVEQHMIDQLYKYNCGSKGFSKLHSYSFSLSVDAFTLKQEVWAFRRVKHS